GLTVAAIDDSLMETYDLTDDTQGVVVTNVTPNGSASEKGIRPGDVIVEVTQEEVHTPGDVAAKVEAAAEVGRKSVLLLIEAQSGLKFVAVSLEKE
ncbi:MAG: PDZ domain-containing protein, partial [Rhodospirillales bacterium]|nr:PDZ domain-containing protein [Rhodospirillales bacterium]